MADHTVTFDNGALVTVPTGTLLTEAAIRAGVSINEPCGGQGRCGRCAVKVVDGSVRRRSVLRLSAEDVAEGYALACQSVVEGDVQIFVPEQDALDRRLSTDRLVADVTVPVGYDSWADQSLQRINVTLVPPTMDDQRDDWSRLEHALNQQLGLDSMTVSLSLLRQIGAVLREGEWQATALVALDHDGGSAGHKNGRLIALKPGHTNEDAPLWGVSIDIGTTTVTVWLVNLISGEVLTQASEYNRQIRRGEDVISRIIYAGKKGGHQEMRELVLTSINTLINRACDKLAGARSASFAGNGSDPKQCSTAQIVKATIAGNSIMTHLLLDIPAESIRQSPFITAVNRLPTLSARDVGLDIYPEAPVICLPGVASYVGSDISSGVLSSGLDDMEEVALFMDIGTNGETVLGCRDWLVTCACSAGPAFEGAGVKDGMRATRGAVEEIWIDSRTFEPTLRVIGDEKPRGICGSGLISLLSEMFLTGVIDKRGFFNSDLDTERIRRNESGWEYVIAWAKDTWHEKDITITRVDIDNLIRAKAAIYAGISVLADSVGVPLDSLQKVLIGGSFGKFINVEKAVQIGLLPDMPWESFLFLGNTSVLGAYYALLDKKALARINEIAGRMTYIELSADNMFYEAFTSALFLPHTEADRFPTVAQALNDAVSNS
ncbi:MAG: ASKHA domain-containing protein [Candidatus Promineifilaceae bacterium]